MRGNDEIYVLEDGIDETVKAKLLDIQQKLGVSFDLSYQIMGKACQGIEGIELNDLENDQLDGFEGEYASVYTYPRLQYLETHNQEEISDIVRDTQLSIETACAIWFDRQVHAVMEQLRAYIIND